MEILVVDDDPRLREMVRYTLSREGWEVREAPDGDRALREIERRPPDLVVLDVLMPGTDGLSVCRKIAGKMPILMLSTRGELADRVLGLDLGADDYLPKPFALDELLARVRALLRRVAPAGADDGAPVEAEGVRIDEAARRAWRGTRELELTKTEFELLALLVRNAGIVLSHTTIYEDIWGYDFGPDSKALAVYIGYLRRKTEQDGEPRIVQTVRGVGYTLRAS